MPNVQVQITTTAQGNGAQQAAQGLQQVGATATKAEKQLLAYAQAQARLQSAQGNNAGAARTLEAALNQVNRASMQAINAERQLTGVQNQLAAGFQGGASYAQQFGSTVTSSLTSMIGPAAAAAAAFGAVRGAVQSFADAFDFKAKMDATTNSVNLQLKGVRDAKQVWSEAASFGKQYAFTQSEMNGVVAASVGILRTSTSSFTDLAGVLARLQVLAPGKTIEEAAFSVRELASGDITSIAEQFNISRGAAYQMRDAIASGADVVQVLKGYLDSAGVSMDTLGARTEGTIGKMNELKQAQEDLKLAQAEFAQGPGLLILNKKIEVTRGATRALSGDYAAMGESIDQSVGVGSIAFGILNQATNGALAKIVALGNAQRDAAQAADQQAQATQNVTAAVAGEAQAAKDALDMEDRRAAQLDRMSEAAKKHAELVKQLSDDLARTTAQGAQALGQATQTAVSYLDTLETSTREHEDAILQLTQDRAQAKTDAQRQSIDDRIAAEQDGFAQQQQAQAVAYAQEQAAQQQHLGQMLIDYTNTQVAMGNIAAAKGAELTAAIAKEYGVQENLAQTTFASMAASIDAWASSGKGSAQALASSLGATGQAAIETKAKMDALAKQYTAELIQNFNEGKIDAEQLAAALADIPSKVYSEVVITHREVYETGGVSEATPSGGTGRRASGGPVSMGKPYLVGEQGPELVVFNQPGTVIPAGPTARIMGNGLAGGGNIGAGMASADDTTRLIDSQIAFLKATAELSYLLASPIPQIDTSKIQALANETKRVGAVVGGLLVPISEENSAMLEAYAKAVEQSVGILTDLQSLRGELADPHPPLSEAYIRALTRETSSIGAAVGGLLVPISETNMRKLEDYGTAVRGAVGILTDLQSLRGELATVQPPIQERTLTRLADEARMIARAVGGRLLPIGKDTAEKIGLYADAVGSSVSVLKDVSDLSGKLFADYQSPTDAQIGMLAKDANRVVKSVVAAAKTYDTKGLDAGKTFAESVGATFSAFKDGLLFFDALNSGDFRLRPSGLAAFEAATAQTLGVVRRLGAQAAAIPPADLAALQNTTAALSSQAEALIRLAAVPFGDLPQATKGFAQQSGALLGGAAGVTVNIYNPPANLNTAALITQIKQALTTSATMRR